MKIKRNGMMFETMTRRGLLGLSLAFSFLQLNCSGAMNGSQSTTFSSSGARTVTAQQMVDTIKTLQNPENKAIYEQARAVQLSSVFNNAMTLVSNDPVDLGGHSFTGMQDLMAEHNDDLQAIADSYGTVGSLMDAVGITSLSEVSAERFQQAYDEADKLFNQGLANAANNSTKTTTNSNNSMYLISSVKGLSLGMTWGCAGSMLGAMGSAVGAGAACAGTLGAGCASAGLGAAGATVGAMDACKNMFGDSGGDSSSSGSSSSGGDQQNGGKTVDSYYGGGGDTGNTDGQSYGGDSQSGQSQDNSDQGKTTTTSDNNGNKTITTTYGGGNG